MEISLLHSRILLPAIITILVVPYRTEPHHHSGGSSRWDLGGGVVGSSKSKQVTRRSKSSRKAYRSSTRSLAIPSGTVLKLTPEIKIPVSRSEDEAVSCSSEFVASFPLSITFKEVSWKKMAQELFVLDPIRRRDWDRTSHFQYDNAIHPHRKSRDLKTFANRTGDDHFTPAAVVNKRSNNNKCPVKSLADRRNILEQVEIAGLRMFGWDGDGRGCLLRAVCELHEGGGIQHELGVLGEAIGVVFSFEEISRECQDEPEHRSLVRYLRDYVGAEVAGRGGACGAYHRGCGRSIFSHA